MSTFELINTPTSTPTPSITQPSSIAPSVIDGVLSPPTSGPGGYTEFSIIRALDEVQVLDKRITKKVAEANFTAMFSKKNRQTLLPEPFGHSAKSDWQGINDLIARRNAIKSAILISNATNKVTVAGEELTIAEVIERKKSLSLQINLLTKLKTQRESVLRSIEQNNVQMDSELQKLLEIHFGKGSNNKGNSNNSNSSSNDVEEISRSFRENNSAKLLDPIGIDSKIKELEDYVDQFQREIKFILSESNAITRIMIKNSHATQKNKNTGSSSSMI